MKFNLFTFIVITDNFGLISAFFFFHFLFVPFLFLLLTLAASLTVLPLWVICLNSLVALRPLSFWYSAVSPVSRYGFFVCILFDVLWHPFCRFLYHSPARCPVLHSPHLSSYSSPSCLSDLESDFCRSNSWIPSWLFLISCLTTYCFNNYIVRLEEPNWFLCKSTWSSEVVSYHLFWF